MQITGYRCMWIVVMFDLPTDTKQARRQYTQFRKFLLKDGFAKMQYSVYVRHCASRENTDVHIQRIRNSIPADGEVRVITITDKQYARMLVFWGKRRQAPEPAPKQLEFF
jgi:CRISPR-associated protein Cas2